MNRRYLRNRTLNLLLVIWLAATVNFVMPRLVTRLAASSTASNRKGR